MKFEIPGRLPGLNEIIDAAKSHYAKYSTEKKEYTEEVAWLAKQARLPRFEKAHLVITWYEPDRRRDPDNIMAGQKFILDGLVQAGVFPGDSQKYIQGIYHWFRVDRKNPRVEVVIEDCEGGKQNGSYPSTLLEGFTTRQLVEELFRRIGTEKEVIEDDF